MPRALLPGRWNRHGRAIPDAQACELDNVVPLRPRSPVCVRPAITVHRISRLRRARRFLRALLHFLTAERLDLL